jgi:hypothetical protein
MFFKKYRWKILNSPVILAFLIVLLKLGGLSHFFADKVDNCLIFLELQFNMDHQS